MNRIGAGIHNLVNAAEKLLRVIDRFQQRRRWLAFPVAVWKKFGDDRAGNLAALIAFYSFVSIFPLLLVLVTVLDLVLMHDPALRQKVLSSALADYPVIGPQLRASVRALHETGAALAIGLAAIFLGARGVAAAAQNAFNTVWEVPLSQRPGFPWSWLRSIGLIAVVGLGETLTSVLSGIAGGAGHVITGAGAHIGAIAVSLVLNIGLFWLGFRLATARVVAGRDLRLGALVAGVAWQILQIAGGYVVAHQLAHSSSLYGAFGIVLGLIAWLYLQAEITLYAVEVNVVQASGLWPRSLFPPPLTTQDRRALQLYAKAQERRPEEVIDVRISAGPFGAGGSGGTRSVVPPGGSTKPPSGP